MRIFGIGLGTIIIVAVAYWAGSRNVLGGVLSTIRGAVSA